MTIIGGQGNFAFLADRTSWATTIIGALVGTLCAYVFVVAAGMSTVFTTDEQQRHGRVKLAAVGFYLQVVLVIVFAFLLAVAVFTNHFDSDSSTNVGGTDPATFSSEFGSTETVTTRAKDDQERPSYTVLEDGESHVFAVGGVMRMGVGSRGEGEERLEYVVPGSWIGPVVVERLR